MTQSNDSKFIYGIVVPNIISLVVVGGSKFLVDLIEGSSGIFIFSDFIIVPLLMGIVSAYFWRDLQMKTSRYVGWSGVNAIVAILMSFIFLKEGVICLIIVSPLIFGFIVAGAFIGKMMYKKKNNMLRSSVFGILLILFIADTFSEHQNISKVSDTIIINAPIEKVWPLVVEYKPIKANDNYWLFEIGMPSPVQSTVDGYHVGAGRKCIFSNGYIFDEKIVVYKPNEELTFDIITQPQDPEIMGHIDILRGQFILKDNGDGTTTLIGNSWYKLYVFPTWYFNIWSKSITRNVHLRVMEHIKILSEENV